MLLLLLLVHAYVDKNLHSRCSTACWRACCWQKLMIIAGTVLRAMLLQRAPGLAAVNLTAKEPSSQGNLPACCVRLQQ
jgi:hypothetical protein